MINLSLPSPQLRPTELSWCGVRRALLSLPCLLLACNSPNSEDNTTGGGCSIEEAVQQRFVEGESFSAVCVISAAEHNPADPSQWELVTDCEQDTQRIEFTFEPPLEEFPVEVGEVAFISIDEGIIGHHFELMVDGELRLSAIDIRLPEADAFIVEDPLFPPGAFEFEWSTLPDCVSSDPQCGAVEARGVRASLSSPDSVVAMLDPQQAYGEISDGDQRYGLWLGSNWTSDCSGEPTTRVSYVVAALPL